MSLKVIIFYASPRSEWSTFGSLLLLALSLSHRNLKIRNSPHPPVSLAPILDAASTPAGEPVGSPNITNAGITRSGYPIITLSNGDAYTYSREMYTWLRLSESWWAIISQYWDASGLRPASGSNSQGTIGLIERRTDDEVVKMGRGRYLQRVLKATMMKDGFKGLETAVSVGHLEVIAFPRCI